LSKQTRQIPKIIGGNKVTAVTNAQFASLHGLKVGPVPLFDHARFASQTARSSRAQKVGCIGSRLPSAFGIGVHSGCAPSGSPPALHFPRHQTRTEASKQIILPTAGASAEIKN
jgi:hypothetical protein